ncbi:uncharacterized protein LOC111473743 [Cucurbita maxima]|uniref:Uncharacterized protein LOC111473743 n=1 Tax=Cucurbita maxima TaxID=3661 RepID=A0A6J1IF84_CUCMA|nr:uncharacterized protein LOC111473743 [Cucurbita maxima]
MRTTAHVINKFPQSKLGFILPFEILRDMKPTVSYFGVFGCVCYVFVPDHLGSKFDKKAVKCIFVGYENQRKGWKCCDITRGKYDTSRDVVFDEAFSWWSSEKQWNFRGVISFIYGVVAENKKPASRTPIPGKGTVICQYPADPTVALGYLSVGFLLASSIAGYLSLFYPYQGKPVPRGSMFKSSTSSIFFNIALFTTGLTITLLVWPTITEKIHLTRNVHQNLETACPTAKTGLLGGGAFLSLDSSLFWLVALMWAGNAREDYFDEIEENGDSVEALKNSA